LLLRGLVGVSFFELAKKSFKISSELDVNVFGNWGCEELEELEEDDEDEELEDEEDEELEEDDEDDEDNEEEDDEDDKTSFIVLFVSAIGLLVSAITIFLRFSTSAPAST